MILTSEYLQERFCFWIDKIAEAGIWDRSKFLPVELIMRKKSKRFAGKFVRKYKLGVGGERFKDHIIIYRKSTDISPKEIDEILVHEMIHLYICQNNLKDTSAHGKLFKYYMNEINRAFGDLINISLRLSGTNEKGSGSKNHLLLVLWFDNNEIYCCDINPKKINYFRRFLDENRFRKNLMKFGWYTSNNTYFDSFVTCYRSLHGKKMSAIQLDQLFEECKITPIL